MVIKHMFATLAIAVLLSACGGGSSGGSGVSDTLSGGGGGSIASAAANVQPTTIDTGPSGNDADVLFTSVVVCAPGSTTNCQTIDHMMIDTGSSGVRIVSSVLNSTLASALPAFTSAGGNPIAECTQFADGSSWGPLKTADIKISGEVASSIPVQVIGEASGFTLPGACPGPAENTVATFGANGLVGLGEFIQDCGENCATRGSNGFYYFCPCTADTGSTEVDLNLQVVNPVAKFFNDNNGVIIELPSIPATGQATVSGALVFGIGTQTNNAIGSATVIPTDPTTGYITTVYKNTPYTLSLFDSGSSAYYFQDESIAPCPTQSIADGFYCPSPPLALSAVIQGTNNVSIPLQFDIGDAVTLFNDNPTYAAFDNIGIPQSGVFIWGLPAFFGRHVFVAIEGQTTSAGAGPYFAF